MMTLSFDELKKIVDWLPISPGFGRDQAFETKVKPILLMFEAIDGVGVVVLEDGGLANYAEIFVHRNKNKTGNILGLYFNFSLLTPLFAFGRGSIHVTENSCGSSSLEPDAILSKYDLDSEFEKQLWSLLEKSEYHALSVDDALIKLPQGITPYEYCLTLEPWDRVFHALFCNTD